NVVDARAPLDAVRIADAGTLVVRIVQHRLEDRRSGGGSGQFHPSFDGCEECCDARPRLPLELLAVMQGAGRLVQTLVSAYGFAGDVPLGFVTDSAGGHIDDAAECEVVVRIDCQAKEGKDVLDFRAIIKTHSPDDAVRDARATHAILQRTRQGMTAI